MNGQWLASIFLEAGVPTEVAEKSARVALDRLLSFSGASRPRPGERRLIEAFTSNPRASMDRILGDGPSLPLFDPDQSRLSVAAIASVLEEGGEDPVVAMAVARVVVEMVEPEDFYRPVWEGLGHEGTPDLEALLQADWRPLRKSATHRPDAPPPPRRR